MQVVDELFVCRTGNTFVGCCVRIKSIVVVAQSLSLNTIVDYHLMIEGSIQKLIKNHEKGFFILWILLPSQQSNIDTG